MSSLERCLLFRVSFIERFHTVYAGHAVPTGHMCTYGYGDLLLDQVCSVLGLGNRALKGTQTLVYGNYE